MIIIVTARFRHHIECDQQCVTKCDLLGLGAPLADKFLTDTRRGGDGDKLISSINNDSSPAHYAMLVIVCHFNLQGISCGNIFILLDVTRVRAHA